MPTAQQKIVSAMTGKNSRLVIFQDAQKTFVDFKTWDMNPNVTKHNDSINGADRDELDVTLNFYELTGQLYMRRGDILDAHLTYQAVRDANTAPLDMEGAFRLYPNDGTRQSYVLIDLVWDDFRVTQGGRAEKIMCPVSMRFTRLVAAKTV